MKTVANQLVYIKFVTSNPCTLCFHYHKSKRHYVITNAIIFLEL